MLLVHRPHSELQGYRGHRANHELTLILLKAAGEPQRQLGVKLERFRLESQFLHSLASLSLNFIFLELN